jgi:iron complex outermembrane receptor protein
MNDPAMRSRGVRIEASLLPPLLLFWLCAILLPVEAMSAEPGDASASGGEQDPWRGVEEFIVTGSSTIDALTETTMSVTSFDASELADLGVSNVSDVAQFTPNLEIRTASATTPTFFIRGVGLNDFTANASGAVAIYLDGAPRNLPAVQLPMLFDLEGVNVEKGPQGTGPGRNASAGAIRIFTKRPTGDLESYVRADYGNYDFVDVEGALDVPVLADLLAVRSSFRVRQRDGFVTNRCGGLTQADIDAANNRPCNAATRGQVRPGLQKNLNDINVWGARSTARLQPPVEGMEWLLTFQGERTDQHGTVGQNLGATRTVGSSDRSNYRQPEIVRENDKLKEQVRKQFPDLTAREINDIAADRLQNSLASRPLDKLPFEGDYNNPGYERQSTWSTGLRGSWELDRVDLSTVTTFVRYDRERLLDADFSPNEFFEFKIDDDAWQVTQDLGLSGELESAPLQWDTGLFYLQEELDYDQETLNSSGPLEPLFQAFTQKTWAFGAYVDFSYDILDDLTIDAGVRYNLERKLFDAQIYLGPNRQSDQCRERAGGTPPCKRTVTVDQPTGAVKLQYRFDEFRSAYMKYTHGWKSAQFNARDGRVPQQVTDVADPETIDAFEIGFDSAWFDERLNLTAALFWYDYQNYQVFTFTNDAGVPPTRVVINANDAQIYGAEAELVTRPLEGLQVDLRASWIESKFLDFTSSGARNVPGSVNQQFRQVFDYNNNPLPNAPRFKVSGTVQYDLELGRVGTLTPRWDVVWTDSVSFDQTGGRGAPNVGGEIFMPKDTIGQKAFWIQNVRLTYKPISGNVEIAGWVRNVTNEVYKVLAFDASGGPGLVGNLVGDPRTYGLSVRVQY